IWDKLLPAMQSQPLPANSAATQQLQQKLATLAIHPAQGSGASSLAGKVLNRKYLFPGNEQKFESLALSSSDAGKTLTLTARIDGKDLTIPCGYQEWKKGRAPVFGGKLAQFPDEPTASTFAWLADESCVIKSCAYETSYQTTFKLKFDGDQVALDSELNVAFGPTKRPQLIG